MDFTGDKCINTENKGFDPTSQTEDVGDNSHESEHLWVKNLKYVAENLSSWTSDVTNNYEDLDELYQELHDTWSRYVGHVVTNLGGV
jgi:hypothetical protein